MRLRDGLGGAAYAQLRSCQVDVAPEPLNTGRGASVNTRGGLPGCLRMVNGSALPVPSLARARERAQAKRGAKSTVVERRDGGKDKKRLLIVGLCPLLREPRQLLSWAAVAINIVGLAVEAIHTELRDGLVDVFNHRFGELLLGNGLVSVGTPC